MEERETMATFVRGLLDTMPLSSLTQRKVREKYREKFNKTTLNTEQEQKVLHAKFNSDSKLQISIYFMKIRSRS